jgi:tetratricopeptide (TPR) repeat protein
LIDVVFSTPGIIGILGLVAASLFSARASGVLRIAVLGGGIVAAGVLVTIGWPRQEVDQTPGRSPVPPVVAAVEPEGRQRAVAFLAGAKEQLNIGETEGARASYQAARSMFEDLGDKEGQAMAMFGLGNLEHFTGQSSRARDWFAESLLLLESDGTAQDRARVLVALGDLERDTFHGPEAAAYYRRAREQWAAAPEPKSDPHVFLNLATLPDMAGGESSARARLEQADKIYYNIGDLQGRGDVAILFGVLEKNLGRIDAARGRFSDARTYFSGADAPASEARANLALAQTEIARGYNIEAQEALGFTELLYARAEIAPPPAVAMAWGNLERLQGRLSEARAHYSQALDEARAQTDALEAAAWVAIGGIEAQLGNRPEADHGFEIAIQLFDALGDDEARAMAMSALGDFALATDRLPLARQNFTQAIPLLGAAANPLVEARATLGLGLVEAREQYFDAAAQLFAQAESLFADAGAVFGEVLANIALSELEFGRGNETAGTRAFERASRTLAQIDLPVAEANRYLGMPAVQRIETRFGQDEDYGPVGAPAAGVDLRTPEEFIAENIAAYPNHNAQARALRADLEARLMSLLP